MKVEIVGGTMNKTLTVGQIEHIINKNNYDGFIDAMDNIYVIKSASVVCLTDYASYSKAGYYTVKAFCYLDITARIV